MDVEDARFLVTGGASGLGAATARAVVDAGGRVVIGDVDEAEGRATADEFGACARFVRLDVTDDGAANAAVDAALAAFGGLDGVVNCAGVVASGRVVDKAGKPHDLTEFARAVNVNLVGTFNVARLAAAAMAANPDAERRGDPAGRRRSHGAEVMPSRSGTGPCHSGLDVTFTST